MDTLGGLAFAGEAALESCMKENPKRRDEPILNGYMIYEIIFGGGFTVALCIALLKIPELSSLFRFDTDNIYLLTAFFALFPGAVRNDHAAFAFRGRNLQCGIFTCTE